jgi:2-polyprenyl-3-methyl-5-hydroxy-6-metoxy-1,4-benzoquinol methylase
VTELSSTYPSRAAQDAQAHFHKIARDFDDLYEVERRSGLRRWLDSKLRASIYRRFELTFECLGDLRGKTVLDVGCGGGRYAVMMAKLGAERVVGADFAPAMIDLAEKLANDEGVDRERISFVCGDVTELSFDEPFDYAFAMGVFDYVEHPVGFLRNVLGKIRTRFVASFPRKWHIWTPQRLIRYRLFKRCPLYFYSRARIESIMRELGPEAGVADYRILPAYRDYVLVIDKE